MNYIWTLIWRVLCQKSVKGRVGGLGGGNYVPQYLWDAYNCRWPWYIVNKPLTYLPPKWIYFSSSNVMFRAIFEVQSTLFYFYRVKLPTTCDWILQEGILHLLLPVTNEQWTWRRHQLETFAAILAICAGNLPVTGEVPTQRPVTQSFDVFFALPE